MEEIKLELEKRKQALAMLKKPRITTKMRFGGLRTRTQRKEIARHRREIMRQKRSYARDIKKIEDYMKARKELESVNNGASIGALSDIPVPKVSLFASPKLRRITRESKLSRLRRYH